LVELSIAVCDRLLIYRINSRLFFF